MYLPRKSLCKVLSKFVVISGCSGGGKSTLLVALEDAGHRVVQEPGRRIVAAAQATNGEALPWVNAEAFAERAMELSLADLAEQSRAKSSDQWVFFDRGLIDAASALAHVTGKSVPSILHGRHSEYHSVFLAPPWPEIYVTDEQRRHGLSQAIDEYERLETTYAELGFRSHILPKVSVTERLKYVLKILNV